MKLTEAKAIIGRHCGDGFLEWASTDNIIDRLYCRYGDTFYVESFTSGAMSHRYRIMPIIEPEKYVDWAKTVRYNWGVHNSHKWALIIAAAMFIKYKETFDAKTSI